MNSRIDILQGDITQQAVDAIVNAANRALSGGGGVDGAIHRAAGPQLQQACRALGPCATGQAKITAAFQLPAKFVIHAVGPVWAGGRNNEAQQLASCYRAALTLAQAHRVKTIAFPAISTGAYGYPRRAAATIARQEIRQHLQHNPLLEKVLLVCFDRKTYQTYLQVWADESAA